MFGLIDNNGLLVHKPYESLLDQGPADTREVRPVKPVGEGEEEGREEAGGGRGESSAQRAYRSSQEFSRRRRPAIHASQIMSSPVITLPLDASLADAWSLFHEKRFRHVPILGSNRKLAGILSDRDLLRHEAGRKSALQEKEESGIRNLIQGGVLAASPDTEIRQIAFVLFKQVIGAMPIIGPADRLEGIITRSDILKTLINQAPLELWV